MEYKEREAKEQRRLAEMVKGDKRLSEIVSEFQRIKNTSLYNERVIEEIQDALKLERAQNYEGAAKIYEGYELWDEAGKVRSKLRVVKNINIELNLNQLMDKISRNGLAVNYKCGNCGAPMTVDKNSRAEGLRFCSYCGSAIDTDALLDVLKVAIG